MEVLIQGGSPSVTVLEFDVSYTVEYTILSSILVELQMPPPGIATRKCLAQAISRRPMLRIVGRQEASEMYGVL